MSGIVHRILVIDEGSPGHLVQSRGLARALAAECGAELAVYSVRLSLRGVFRPVLRAACALGRRGLPDRLLRLAFRLPDTPPPTAEVIVTSGGRGFFYAVSLARRTGAKLVFCGDPAPLPAAWCDVVLGPQPIADHPGSIGTGMLLTEIGPQEIAGKGAALREAFDKSGGVRLATLLIGGDSRSHRYAEEDWADLAAAVNRLGEQGWRWLLSTSRRTPPAVEARLRRDIRSEHLIHAVWWHAAPERVMAAFLDAADVVMVTRDSLSMLSEAVAAGKPTVALAPRRVLPSHLIDTMLEGASNERRLRRVGMAALATMHFDAGDFSLLTADRRPELARTAAARLGLGPAQPPVFGIIVPTYNRPAYLIEAIDSLQAQTYPHWKMLICDDASSADYAQVTPFLTDTRIVMTRAAKNSGPNRARNVSIDRAVQEGCDYIVFMDDEDRLEPQALEVAAAKIAEHPESGWLISNTCGDCKAGQREIEREGRVDWFADYVYGRTLRGDKTHVISLKKLGDIRFDGTLRVETWHFFQPLAARTLPWAYPFPSRRIRYLDDGITRTNSRNPRTWREIRSRYARHLQAVRLRPGLVAAFRYLALELIKTPGRLLHLPGLKPTPSDPEKGVIESSS